MPESSVRMVRSFNQKIYYIPLAGNGGQPADHMGGKLISYINVIEMN
jgi:hypothetical protein